MMTDRTRDDLVTQALINLKVIGSGQSPDADDGATVDGKIDGLFGELESRGIVSVPDDDAIPAEFFNPLAELLANECAPAFGMAKDAGMREDAEARLKIMTRQQPRRLLGTDRIFRVGVRRGRAFGGG